MMMGLDGWIGLEGTEGAAGKGAASRGLEGWMQGKALLQAKERLQEGWREGNNNTIRFGAVMMMMTGAPLKQPRHSPGGNSDTAGRGLSTGGV